MSNPSLMNKAIGLKVSAKRIQQGLTMKALGESLERPVTFQQIQKFEKGLNRISAEQLLDIARVLECSVLDLYPTDAEVHAEPPEKPTRSEENFFRNWLAIPDMKVRESLRHLVADLARGAAA